MTRVGSAHTDEEPVFVGDVSDNIAFPFTTVLTTYEDVDQLLVRFIINTKKC